MRVWDTERVKLTTCHVAEPQALPLNDDTLLEELCLNETVEVKVTALEQSVLLAMWCVQFVA